MRNLINLSQKLYLSKFTPINNYLNLKANLIKFSPNLKADFE